jgi:hypothetical protein
MAANPTILQATSRHMPVTCETGARAALHGNTVGHI